MVRTCLAPVVHNDDATSTKLRLLVVDDDATQRNLIARAAEQAGHAVTTTASIREALEQIGETDFDCVTLDLVLEDGSGTEVLNAMAEANFAGKVILVSGAAATQRIAARTHARRLGIGLRSLPKPLDLSALRVCLADFAKCAMGLPTAHVWGGVRVALEHERHRIPHPSHGASGMPSIIASSAGPCRPCLYGERSRRSIDADQLRVEQR